MNRSTAESLVGTGALVTGAIYGYRYLSEGPGEQPQTVTEAATRALTSKGKVPRPGTFIIAWGFEWGVLAIIAPALPGVAGSFAALILIATLLDQSSALMKTLKTNRKAHEQ